MTFRTFENGIRIAKGFASDPVTGKLGELYWNTVKNVLRQCVEPTTPIWEDVTVKAGSTQYATLYWDAVNERWTENILLLINGKIIYAANSVTKEDLTIQAGNSTGPGEFGGDVSIQPGVGPGGNGKIIATSQELHQADNFSSSFDISAGDSSGPTGNDLNLDAGQGLTDQGNVGVSGKNINFYAGEKIRLNGDVVFSQLLIADPSSPETAELYWNNTFKRFRRFDGTNWHWIDVNSQNIPIVAVDLFDDSILSLPADTTTPIDGMTVTDQMLVVMQNSGSPVIYRAEVAGINITWTATDFGQITGSVPVTGDRIYVTNGVDNIDSGYIFQSTGVWFNPTASSSSIIQSGIDIGNLTRWNGTEWVPDQSLNSSGSGILYAPDDNNNNASKAQNITAQAGNKTNGTGDGGDLNLNAGSSLGGNTGDIVTTANTLIAPINASSVYRLGGLYVDSDTQKLRIGQNTIFRDVDGADINGEITGFEDLSKSVISFTDGTRQFDLSLTGIDPIVIWIKGIRFEFSLTESIIITNTIANHYIYYDTTGTLVSNTSFNLQDGLKNFVLVAIVNWNGSASTLLADRRHLLTMDGDQRYNRRVTQPIQVKAGDFNPTGNVFTGTGSNNIVIGSGNAYIEELVRAVTSKDVSSSQIPMLYLSSTNVSNIVTGASAMLDNSTYLVYNLNTLGTWSQAPITVVPSYFNIWIAVTTDPTKPIVMIQPQNIYLSLAAAAAELPESIVTFWPSTEYRLIHRLTFVNTSFLAFTARKFVNLFDMTPIWSSEPNLILNQNAEKDYWSVMPENQDMYFNPASGLITWTQDIQIGIVGRSNSTNTITAGSITLADGEIAIVSGINKRDFIGPTLTPTVTTSVSMQADVASKQNEMILFKRIGNEVYFMRGTSLKVMKRTSLLDNQAVAVSIFNFPNPTTANYAYQIEYSIYRNGIIETGNIVVCRGSIGSFGQAITGASNGSTGVVLTVAESGSTLQLQYTSTNTGNAPVIRYKITSWLTT